VSFSSPSDLMEYMGVATPTKTFDLDSILLYGIWILVSCAAIIIF